MARLRLAVVALLLLSGGCHSRIFPGTDERGPEAVQQMPEIAGTVVESHEILRLDYLQVRSGTLVVEIDGKRLNKYEFTYKKDSRTVQFRDVVTILEDGRLTWDVPRTPAAFAGQQFKIYFEEEK